MTATTVDGPRLVAQEYRLVHAGVECWIGRRDGRGSLDKTDVETFWQAHVGRAISHSTTTLDDEGRHEVSRYVVTNARFTFDPADVAAEADALERARSYCVAAAEAVTKLRERQLATWTEAEHAVDLAAAAFRGAREVMH